VCLRSFVAVMLVAVMSGAVVVIVCVVVVVALAVGVAVAVGVDVVVVVFFDVIRAFFACTSERRHGLRYCCMTK